MYVSEFVCLCSVMVRKTDILICSTVILVRRPYGIGDRVQVGNIESNGSLHGALPWCVENVTLFETTLVYLPTNERASLSNGSLANSRIINWGRRYVCGRCKITLCTVFLLSNDPFGPTSVTVPKLSSTSFCSSL